MSTLTITRGLPGSGKSTWAAEQQELTQDNTTVSNRDGLRMLMFGSCNQDYYAGGKETTHKKEQLVTTAQHAEIEAALKAGFDVICSDTNLPVRRCRDLRALATRCGAEFEINESFASVPLETCLERNAQRTDKEPVPEKVIRDMHQRYVRGGLAPVPAAEDDDMGFVGEYGVEPVVKDNSLPPAYIFDIDGTLAIHGTRNPYDFSRVHEDEVFEDVWRIAWDLNRLPENPTVIIMSGRSSECYDATEAWLDDKSVMYDELYMRAIDDKRQDWRVKYDLFNEHVRGRYNVRGVFDDRDQVVALWRQMGLTCFQVNYGDF